MPASNPRTKRWTRLEYERLVDLGAFRSGEPVELLGGDLMVCEPQGTPHMTAIRMAEEVLRRTFAAGWEVRTQAPVALDDESEPERAVRLAVRLDRQVGAGRARQPARSTPGSRSRRGPAPVAATVAAAAAPGPAAPSGPASRPPAAWARKARTRRLEETRQGRSPSSSSSWSPGRASRP